MTVLSTKILDHIIHLAPPGGLQDTVNAFRKLGFTVTPGGRHGSGLTENALIVFPDGTYLELAHYMRDPPPDTTHPWAKKQPGWIDYVFLGNGGSPSLAELINARAEKEGTTVRYEEEVTGSRKREDGTVLEWTLTGRAGELGQRGRLPFFCGDLTPREWRVPLEPSTNAEHENGATGVAYIKVLVESNRFDTTVLELTSVLGAKPDLTTTSHATWDLDEQPQYGAGKTTPKLVISIAQDGEEQTYVQQRGPGVYEVAFQTGGVGSNVEGPNRSPHGKIVWAV